MWPRLALSWLNRLREAAEPVPPGALTAPARTGALAAPEGRRGGSPHGAAGDFPASGLVHEFNPDRSIATSFVSVPGTLFAKARLIPA